MAGTVAVVDVDTGTILRRLTVGGVLTALKIDRDGRLLVLQSDTGRILRGDRSGGPFVAVAQGEPGLDNLAVDVDGTIYVSNYITGQILRIDPDRGSTVRLFPNAGPTGFPVSITPTEDGTAWVSTFNSVLRLGANGSLTRLFRLFLDRVGPDRPILFTGGAAEMDGWLYFSDAFPTVDQRISRQHLSTGVRDCRRISARGRRDGC